MKSLFQNKSNLAKIVIKKSPLVSHNKIFLWFILSFVAVTAYANPIFSGLVHICTTGRAAVKDYANLAKLYLPSSDTSSLGGKNSTTCVPLGSGIVIDKNGYILTQAEVLESNSDIFVKFPQGPKHYRAKIVGYDLPTFIGLLKVEGAVKEGAVSFANPKALELGDKVQMGARPFEQGEIFTNSTLAAKGDQNGNGIVGLWEYDFGFHLSNELPLSYLGGGVFDPRGRFLGMIVAKNAPSLTGSMFIPWHLASPIVDAIKKDGHVRRPWLGIAVKSTRPFATDDLMDKKDFSGPPGLMITNLVTTSPAAKAGLKLGDIILKVETKAIGNPVDLRQVLLYQRVGMPVKIRYFRAGAGEDTLSLTFEEKPVFSAPNQELF